MCVHGSQAVCCTTELCLSVDKLKEETTTGKERCQCPEVNVKAVYILSTVQTENTYTPARLEARFKSSPFLSHLRLYHSYHPGFEAQVSPQATVFAIHPDVSGRDLQCCSSCPLDSQVDVSPVSTVVLPSIVFQYV